jgi:hypothetical protein
MSGNDYSLSDDSLRWMNSLDVNKKISFITHRSSGRPSANVESLLDHTSLTEMLNIPRTISIFVDSPLLRFARRREDNTGKGIGSFD